MRERRVRATFLLKLVILGASVGVFVVAFATATSGPARLGTLAVLLVFWFVAIEADLLPMLIEHLARTRASQHRGSSHSAWFVDLEAQRRRQMERLREGTQDNPTLQ